VNKHPHWYHGKTLNPKPWWVLLILVVKALFLFFGDDGWASSSSSIGLSIECDLNLLDKLKI
jgi:hypothetical protein